MGAVEDYLSYYGAHQWQQLRTVFDHSDFERTGYNDAFTDANKYARRADVRRHLRGTHHA